LDAVSKQDSQTTTLQQCCLHFVCSVSLLHHVSWACTIEDDFFS